MNSQSVYAVTKRTLHLFTLLGMMLFIMNVLLIQQNKELKVQAQKRDRTLELKPGTELPAMVGMDMDENKSVLDYSQDMRKTLLFIFSPRCRACKENMPNWESMIKQLDKDSYRIVGVSLVESGTKEYVASNKLGSIPVISELDAESRIAYSLALTPQTILINSEGRVEKVWTGRLSGQDKQDAERSLNISMP